MHAGEVDTDVSLVRQLLAAEFSAVSLVGLAIVVFGRLSGIG